MNNNRLLLLIHYIMKLLSTHYLLHMKLKFDQSVDLQHILFQLEEHSPRQLQKFNWHYEQFEALYKDFSIHISYPILSMSYKHLCISMQYSQKYCLNLFHILYIKINQVVCYMNHQDNYSNQTMIFQVQLIYMCLLDIILELNFQLGNSYQLDIHIHLPLLYQQDTFLLYFRDKHNLLHKVCIFHIQNRILVHILKHLFWILMGSQNQPCIFLLQLNCMVLESLYLKDSSNLLDKLR